MTRFVEIKGYTINPDHVVRVSQWDNDVGGKNTFVLKLFDGESLKIVTETDVSKQDIIDHLTGKETYCFQTNRR